MTPTVSKRVFLSAGGLCAAAVLTGSSAISQENDVISVDIDPEEAGRIHQSEVLGGIDFIIGNDPLSADSLSASTDRLTELGLIDSEERNAILELINAIMESESIGEMVDRVQELYDQFFADLDRLSASIATIIRNSVQIANEILQDEVMQTVTRAIAHDIRGALDGAAAGSRWGLPGAIIGAICGAASASIVGFYDRQPT